MACSQTLAGIARDCAANMGGVKAVYLANSGDVASVTVTSGAITAITMEASKKFYKYEFQPNTASLSSNYAVNAENGTKYVETDLVMVFNRMETAKRLEVTAMAQGALVAIVEDNNGKMWYLGYEEPIYLNAGDGLTGTNRADRNGYSVTLHDTTIEMPMEFTGTIPLS